MEPAGVIAAVLISAAGYALAYRRKGRVGSVHVGSRTIELRTSGEPLAVFDAIAAIGPPYHVDDADRDKRMLVLSSRPSIWSYGFLYPVIVHADGAATRIEISVQSRFFHVGPGMGRAHVLCAKAIESLLTVPPARIA